MYKNVISKVRTGEVRLSYCHLLEPVKPKDRPNADPKYNCVLLIPKTDAQTMANIRSTIEATAQAALATKFGGVMPPDIYSCIHDGDGVKPNTGRPYGDEAKGHWVLNASSGQKPGVVKQTGVNSQGKPVFVDVPPQEIYSGMYGEVILNFFPYTNGRIGIGCGLNNILKTRDGAPLSGGASADEDFGGVMAGSEAANDFAGNGGMATQPVMRRDPVTGKPIPVT